MRGLDAEERHQLEDLLRGGTGGEYEDIGLDRDDRIERTLDQLVARGFATTRMEVIVDGDQELKCKVWSASPRARWALALDAAMRRLT